MILLLAAALLNPAAAIAPVPAPAEPAPYEVVRAGDREMSCPVLIGEINTINAQVQRQQAQQMAGISMGRSAMMSMGGGGGAGGMVGNMVMGSVASMVPFGGYAVAAAQRARIGAAQKQMMDSIDTMQQQSAAMVPVYQRLDHLRELYDSKSC